MFVTSGYYKGVRDNIKTECQVSCKVQRWSYDHNQIKICTDRYIKELLDKKMNIDSLSIVSAKYIGWNVKHPDYDMMSNILYNEYCENLQGNIILTYMSAIYKEKIYNHYNDNYVGAVLNPHRYAT